MPSQNKPGLVIRQLLAKKKTMCFAGVYDVLSASIAAERFDGIFCSGFSLSASFLGMPDAGHVTWRDVSDFAQRIRARLEGAIIIVDGEDGFGDKEVAAAVVQRLEQSGVNGIVIEDQAHPKKCGHFDGKALVPVDEFIAKLRHVLKERKTIFVIARTDAADMKEAVRRVAAYARCGVDAVMIDGVSEPHVIRTLTTKINCPVAISQIYGGKSQNWTVDELKEMGVSIVLYSTICLFPAQYALKKYLDDFQRTQKMPVEGSVKLQECDSWLKGIASPAAQRPTRRKPV